MFLQHLTRNERKISVNLNIEIGQFEAGREMHIGVPNDEPQESVFNGIAETAKRHIKSCRFQSIYFVPKNSEAGQIAAAISPPFYRRKRFGLF